jgi:hypothetical protein
MLIYARRSSAGCTGGCGEGEFLSFFLFFGLRTVSFSSLPLLTFVQTFRYTWFISRIHVHVFSATKQYCAAPSLQGVLLGGREENYTIENAVVVDNGGACGSRPIPDFLLCHTNP